jgi:hypothetical protein
VFQERLTLFQERLGVFTHSTLGESDVHYLLSNPRRRETLTLLSCHGDAEPIPLRDLSEQVAAKEAGVEPAPRPLRQSVYNALHQTHLPKLADFDLVEYDPVGKSVRARPEARQLNRYMDTVTGLGMTWGEYYRAVGIAGLCLVVASLAEVPAVNLVDPLLLASGTLVLFAVSTLYQLFTAPIGAPSFVRKLFDSVSRR